MFSKWFSLVQDARMSYSPHFMSREMYITLYQRTLLGTSANQKRHYLKSYIINIIHNSYNSNQIF